MNILRFFQYKYQESNWHCRKKGQPRFLICASLVGPTSPMLHTKSQGHGILVLGKEILKGFILYGHGGHLSHVIINVIFTTLNLWSLQINCPTSGFWANCFQISMGLKYERPWVKEQRSTLNFGTYYRHWFIRFNRSSENYDFGFNSILISNPFSVIFVRLDSLRPINNLSVTKGRVILDWTSTKLGLMFLLKDTTQWRRWGSNPRPLGLKSNTLPMSHCATFFPI